MNTKLNKFFAVILLGIVATFSANAMLSGPDFIYECPQCSNLLRNSSLMSGNTFGATIYSDNRMIAQMLPEFPNLTKCKKCDTILWLSMMEEVGRCGAWGSNSKPEWEDADRVTFLDVADLARFLEWDIVKNDKEKELTVRQRIWWTFNDRTRAGKELFIDESDETLWRENCLRLIEMLDRRIIYQRIVVAELYRNLGMFDESIKLLGTIIFEENSVTVERLKAEAENGNKFVIRLRN